MTQQPEISIVIPTYNRAQMLRDTILSVLEQIVESQTEIIIVDNNSSDDTKSVVRSLAEDLTSGLHYLVETKQGNAHARNAGIKHARGNIIAFLDDDVTVSDYWLNSLKKAFQKWSDVSFVGGKVLPSWDEAPPSWLTRDHWSPLALLDYGSQDLPISGNNPLGLLTANIAFRRNVFEDVGTFSPRLQRVKDRIGSLEDHEFLMRLCRSGLKGRYVPDMVATTSVPEERLTKAYHRRWHTGHGHFYALMNDPQWEGSKFRILGVPGHLYRQTARHAASWLWHAVRGRQGAFLHECHLRFFRGYFLARQREVVEHEQATEAQSLEDVAR